MAISLENLSIDKACLIVYLARAFDVKVAPVETEIGSNATDDAMRSVVEDNPDDPTLEELASALADLNLDAMRELIALVLVGRGDYDVAEWETALDEAGDRLTDHPVRYLVGTPLLGDYLEEGLSALGYSCESFELSRL